jgi:glycogen synthase
MNAMPCSEPVIAYGRGGALETVVDSGNNRTGLFFREQTMESLVQAIERFRVTTFDTEKIREHALKFSRDIYKSKMKNFIEKKISE